MPLFRIYSKDIYDLGRGTKLCDDGQRPAINSLPRDYVLPLSCLRFFLPLYNRAGQDSAFDIKHREIVRIGFLVCVCGHDIESLTHEVAYPFEDSGKHSSIVRGTIRILDCPVAGIWTPRLAKGNLVNVAGIKSSLLNGWPA